MSDTTARRTKRRYAHELYPHPGEFEDARPLEVEVPYLYAQAIGRQIWGTAWFDLMDRYEKGTLEFTLAAQLTSYRSILLVETRQHALLADALLQGLSGDEAWKWAHDRMDEEGGWVWERAEHYGVPVEQIKPYPCGPERGEHDHPVPHEKLGVVLQRIDCPESECEDCTEPVPSDEPGASQ